MDAYHETTHTSQDNCHSLLSLTENTREDDLSHLFAICEILSLNSSEKIPVEWAFIPSKLSKEIRTNMLESTWPESEWFDLMSADRMTEDDLIAIGWELVNKLKTHNYEEA